MRLSAARTALRACREAWPEADRVGPAFAKEWADNRRSTGFEIVAGLCPLGSSAREMLPDLASFLQSIPDPENIRTTESWQGTMIALGGMTLEAARPPVVRPYDPQKYRAYMQKLVSTGCRPQEELPDYWR